MVKYIATYFDWAKGYTRRSLKADVLAGLTVALILIPQSMAVLASREDRNIVESFARAGEQTVAESPVLSKIARPLDPLEAL